MRAVVVVGIAGVIAGTALHLLYERHKTARDTAAPPIAPAVVTPANEVTPATEVARPLGGVPAGDGAVVAPPSITTSPPRTTYAPAGAEPISLPLLEPSSDASAGGGVSTQLVIPVQGIRASDLRDTYADARGSGRRHDAIDIMAAHNTPVLAAAPAVVVKRDNGARGGIALYARAADNRTIYYYAHLDRYAPGIVEGTRLRAGDVIGYVGDTGNSGAGNYHLHFEIMTTSDPKRYWGGVSMNPYPLLRNGITR